LLIAGNLTTKGKRLPEAVFGLQPNTSGVVLSCYKG
jgi:hypothetical protein